MRKKMVTRTITTTDVTVLVLNTETCEPYNTTITLTSTYKDEVKMMKAVKEIVDTETVKAVKIVCTTEKETLYGMPEEDFVKNAKILPPRTKAEDETETEVDFE